MGTKPFLVLVVFILRMKQKLLNSIVVLRGEARYKALERSHHLPGSIRGPSVVRMFQWSCLPACFTPTLRVRYKGVLLLKCSINLNMLKQYFFLCWGVGMAQWWENLSPTYVARGRFLDSASCGLSLLVLYSAPRGFLRVLRFPLYSKTSIWLDLRWLLISLDSVPN